MGSEAFRRCEDMFHPGESCPRYIISSMPSLAARSLKMYAPIHVLPLLLFQFKAVAASPLPFMVSTARATAMSAAFLTMYGNAMKSAICGCRSLRRCVCMAQYQILCVCMRVSVFCEYVSRCTPHDEMTLLVTRHAHATHVMCPVSIGHLPPR